jgi:hypothetical protein
MPVSWCFVCSCFWVATWSESLQETVTYRVQNALPGPVGKSLPVHQDLSL